MLSSPRLPSWALVLLILAGVAGPAALTRAQAPGPGTVVLSDGSQVRGTILLYVQGQKVVLETQGQTLVYQPPQLSRVVFDAPAPSSTSSAAQPPPPAPAGYVLPPLGQPMGPPPGMEQHDFFRVQEVARLEVQRESLRASNRRWQTPAAMLGLAVSSMFIGAGVFVSSWNYYNDTQWRTGVAMMTLGGALVLISTPMLIMRASRASRLKRIERTILRLGGQLSLAPVVTPRGAAGLGARLVF
jgi:hypothetical protein